MCSATAGNLVITVDKCLSFGLFLRFHTFFFFFYQIRIVRINWFNSATCLCLSHFHMFLVMSFYCFRWDSQTFPLTSLVPPHDWVCLISICVYRCLRIVSGETVDHNYTFHLPYHYNWRVNYLIFGSLLLCKLTQSYLLVWYIF